LAAAAPGTVCATAAEVEPVKFELPAYTAVMLWVPTVKVVVYVATPLLRMAVPIVVPPSLKVTEPVPVSAPGVIGVTVAVKVTDWPEVETFVEEDIDVGVLAIVSAIAWAIWLFPALLGCTPSALYAVWISQRFPTSPPVRNCPM